uniref:Uncharacterized protein n=1 Tax=Nelumbo nucifera TaxID=4432 RepID=A0A822YC19_NELNU|nr:TPA_asm: hypothetical protein HUJ06_030307 [Nelumbo nucifera]
MMKDDVGKSLSPCQQAAGRPLYSLSISTLHVHRR